VKINSNYQQLYYFNPFAMKRPSTGLELRFRNGILMISTFSEICRLYVVDVGCDLPPNLWAESPDLSPVTINCCESYGHLNADFYSQPNINTYMYLSRRYCDHIHLHYGVTFGCQSTRHTVNSSQPKIVWRVDRRLKRRVVTSWPAMLSLLWRVDRSLLSA